MTNNLENNEAIINLQLVDSLAKIINSLTREEKQILQTKIDLTEALKNNSKEHQAWHEFVENTYGSIDDESFTRHPQGEFEVREFIE